MRVELGDIIQIRFKDHFSFNGKMPEKQMMLQSFGRLTHEDENGYVVMQTEVYEADPSLVEPNETGQFILKEAVVEIVKLHE